MSLCYLCDLCKRPHIDNERSGFLCTFPPIRDVKLAIDYGKDDPKSFCRHFEPKEGA